MSEPIVIVTDPVSHVTLNRDDAVAKSAFNGTMYYFADPVNKQSFDEDPMLWVSTPHASLTSADVNLT